MVKDADEIALLRRGGPRRRPGRRPDRRRPAGRPDRGRRRPRGPRAARRRGPRGGLFAIVGSGPNSASPHHEASDRVIRAGEPIVLDIGGTLGGYGSDITRTLWVTGGDPAQGPDERFRHLFGVLHARPGRRDAGRRAGRRLRARSTRPRASRSTAAGYGEAFFHRTGHGIGLEGHEDPYLVAGNADAARGRGWRSASSPASTSPGEYGARIEDIVVCGPDGADPLNEAPRELLRRRRLMRVDRRGLRYHPGQDRAQAVRHASETDDHAPSSARAPARAGSSAQPGADGR